MILFSFTSCNTAAKITPKSVFSADYDLSYNEMQIKGSVSTFNDDKAEITVESPKSLKGFKATVDDGIFEIAYNGISMNYTKDDLPEGAFMKLILLSLEQITDSEDLEFQKQDGEYVATKSDELGEINITLNDDFFIKSIKIPKQEFYLELTEKFIQ